MTRERVVTCAIALVLALAVGRVCAGLWEQVSEGGAASAVTKRIIKTAVEFHCRQGRYPTSVGEMGLDLTDTDGGSEDTLRWVEYRSAPDWFGVRNRVIGGDESQYFFDPSYYSVPRRSAVGDVGGSAAPTREIDDGAS